MIFKNDKNGTSPYKPVKLLDMLGIRDISSEDRREVDRILDLFGQVLYDFDLIGPKFSLFAGTYQLPITPRHECYLTGNWLKIPVKTDILPSGVFLQDLLDERLLTALRSALGRNVETRLAPSSSPASILMEKSGDDKGFYGSDFDLWFFVEFDRSRLRGIRRHVLFEALPPPPDSMILPIPFGSGVADRPIFYDMVSDLIGMIVAGATRQGKSVFMNSILHYLCDLYSPYYFKAYLADFKQGVEFMEFSDYPQASFFGEGDLPRFLDLMEDINKSRWSVIRDEGCKNVVDYNSSSSPGDGRFLPYSLAVVDEAAAISLVGGREDMKRLQLLVAQSAGAGLYWIIGTQRPSVDYIPGSLKANLNCRVCFSLPVPVDVETVFGEGVTNAVQLGIPGRAWAMVSDQFFEFQAPYRV